MGKFNTEVRSDGALEGRVSDTPHYNHGNTYLSIKKTEIQAMFAVDFFVFKKRIPLTNRGMAE